MTQSFWICCLTFAIGVVIVALPDSGPRVFSISELHGPSLIDVLGLVMVMIPWTYSIIYALLKWRRVLFVLGRPLAALSLAAAFTGLVVTTISVSRDGPYWWMGALIAFAGQFAWIVAAFRK